MNEIFKEETRNKVEKVKEKSSRIKIKLGRTAFPSSISCFFLLFLHRILAIRFVFASHVVIIPLVESTTRKTCLC
jgi:hypothetical protein